MSRGWPDLYAITDRRACHLPLGEAVGQAVAAGLGWLQVREKDLSPAELLRLSRELVAAARPHGVRVLINDRADVALLAGADGVHLTEGGLPAEAVRRAFPDLLVGVSVHSLARARVAALGGADFLMLGPIFATPSKQSYGAPLGLGALREVARAVDVPVVAVGGIGPEQVAPCLEAGASGVAVIRAWLAADDVGAAVKALLGLARRPGPPPA